MLQLGNAHTLIWCLLLCDATLRNLATSVHRRGAGVLFIITASAKLCTPGVCVSMAEGMEKILRMTL